MKLSSDEQQFLTEIHDMDSQEFIEMIISLDDKQYETLVKFVRKMKILGKKLPSYLDNLLDAEYPIALKSHEAGRKGTLFKSLEHLTDKEEQRLALIHFKGNVQYITL